MGLAYDLASYETSFYLAVGTSLVALLVVLAAGLPPRSATET
jgi:hypothetical protein